MIAGNYGYRQVPTRGMSLISGVVIVAFGTLWTAMAATIVGGFEGSMGVFACFPLFGVLFILMGIGVSLYTYSRATQYEQAYQNYQRRRSELLGGRHRQPDEGQG
jgi:hypothetical protein